MDSITTTNTISLNCDIELTNKVISLNGVHLARPHQQQQCNKKNELIIKRYGNNEGEVSEWVRVRNRKSVIQYIDFILDRWVAKERIASWHSIHIRIVRNRWDMCIWQSSSKIEGNCFTVNPFTSSTSGLYAKKCVEKTFVLLHSKQWRNCLHCRILIPHFFCFCAFNEIHFENEYQTIVLKNIYTKYKQQRGKNQQQIPKSFLQWQCTYNYICAYTVPLALECIANEWKKRLYQNDGG